MRLNSRCCFGYLSACYDSYAHKQKRDILFKTVFWISTENPVLRPFTAVDIMLRIIIPYGLFLWYIVVITSKPRSFGGWKIGSRGLL